MIGQTRPQKCCFHLWSKIDNSKLWLTMSRWLNAGSSLLAAQAEVKRGCAGFQHGSPGAVSSHIHDWWRSSEWCGYSCTSNANANCILLTVQFCRRTVVGTVDRFNTELAVAFPPNKQAQWQANLPEQLSCRVIIILFFLLSKNVDVSNLARNPDVTVSRAYKQ